MAKTATNEFIVMYMEDWENHDVAVEKSCKSWNRVAQNQLKRKIENWEDVWEDEHKMTRHFEIGFQNGSKAYFLYIPRDISVFDIHSSLREAFVDGIKEHTNLSFTVKALEERHQKVCVSALTSLITLCQWRYPTYGRKAEKKKKLEHKNYGFYTSLDETEKLIESGELIAEGTNLARTLASTPTNYMTSKDLVDNARKIAKKLKCSVNFINENKLKEMGAGCFLAVIQGSKGSDGGIVHLKYRTRKKNAKDIAIVGKGVTFDTGGYDIKTDGYMKDMHRDMTGAAVSLSLFQAMVKSKPRANIDLYLAVGENLISEDAYKPNDVVIAMDGTSVEVGNTDAEGRMLMIDTIIYAKQQDPDLILDYATLTGDCISAIDNRYSAVLSNDYGLSLKAVLVGEACGERVWNFPTSRDFMETLGSKVADISQCTSSDNAEHIYAACLLMYFANPLPWVHVDLAAEYNVDGLGLVDTEVTGFGVRWGYEFLHQFIKENQDES